MTTVAKPMMDVLIRSSGPEDFARGIAPATSSDRIRDESSQSTRNSAPSEDRLDTAVVRSAKGLRGIAKKRASTSKEQVMRARQQPDPRRVPAQQRKRRKIICDEDDEEEDKESITVSQVAPKTAKHVIPLEEPAPFRAPAERPSVSTGAKSLETEDKASAASTEKKELELKLREIRLKKRRRDNDLEKKAVDLEKEKSNIEHDEEELEVEKLLLKYE